MAVAQGAGIGVDAQGGPVVDPTANVLALVKAAVIRLDDLAACRDALALERYESLRREMELRAQHADQVQHAEAQRQDAIQGVAEMNRSTAADRALAAIEALARNTAATAEALRVGAEATAKGLATQFATEMARTNDRLVEVERAQYEGRGKSTVADPLMAQLLIEVKALRETGASGSGRGAGMAALAGWIVAGLTLMALLVTLAVKLMGH